MPRRRSPGIRKIVPDAKHHDVMVTRFINYIMLDGKKSVVEKAVYDAFDKIEEKLKRDAIEAFHEAIANITPKVEVRSRRIGGSTYQVPTEVSERRGSVLALNWIVRSIRSQSGRTLGEKIFKALKEALDKTGWAFKKKEDVFKMAESNKAFAHFNW